MKTLDFKTITLVFFIAILNFTSLNLNAQIAFNNPDIENTGCVRCMDCVAPGWTKCANSPDVQPGQHSVGTPPKSGCTYAGFTDGESIGQKLSCPLIGGKSYTFNMWLAYDSRYGRNGVPNLRGDAGQLDVYGGKSSCGTSELLWSSGILPASSNQNWTSYAVNFTPSATYDFILFQNPILVANVLVDNISQTIAAVTPVVILTKDVLDCFNSTDGTITVDIGGTYVYDFAWSDGQVDIGVTASTNNNLPIGSHTVSISDPLDPCIGAIVVPITITGPGPIVINITSEDETCENACDGSVEATVVSGGNMPFDFQWDDPLLTNSDKVNNLCNGTYTVTVSDATNCTSTQSVAVIVADPEFDPGIDNMVIVCDTEIDIDLFLAIGGTPDAGGTWSDESGSGGLTAGTLDATGLDGAYDFKYTLGAAPCIYDATVTVNVNVQPEAGIGYTDVVCQSNDNYNLDNNMTGADIGGTWADDVVNPGGLSGNVFNATQVNPGFYNLTYLTIADAPCVNDTSFVTLEVARSPIAGNDTTIFVCNTSNPINLFAKIGRTPDAGGTWFDDNMTGKLTGSVFNVTGMNTGDYDFTYTVADNLPCLGKSATIRVSVQEQRDAGLDHSFVICKNAPAIILIDSLNGIPDAGGVWTYREGGNQVMGSNFNPAVHLSGNYDYTFDGGVSCATVVATLNITVNDVPTVINAVDTVCDSNNLNYEVRLEIGGGDPNSYTINGVDNGGSSTFTSTWIPTGTSYSFDVDDINGCGPVTITGAYACDCATRAGTMDKSLLDVCLDQLATPTHNKTSLIFDANDVLMYILHTSPNSNIGTVLDSNLVAPDFSFNENGNMLLETTYYISALVGNALPDNTVDVINDLCYNLAPGTPVVFHELPDATMGSDTTICEGQTASLILTFLKGKAPYEVVINDGINDISYTGLSNGSVISVTPTTSTNYTLKSLEDVYNCAQEVSDQQVIVTVNPTPVANFTGTNTTFCEGNGPAQFSVNISDGIPDFDIVYFDAQTQANTTVNQVGLGITTFTNANPLAPGSYAYQLLSITDKSNASCQTVFTDTITIVVHENPDINFTGDATICSGDSTTLLFDFTKGTAGYDVDYSMMGNSRPSLVNVDDPFSMKVSPQNLTGNIVYNIDRLEDSNGCVTNYNNTDKQVTLTINPNPSSLGIQASSIDYCLGTNSTIFDFNFLLGTPDFEIDYSLNGGPTQTITGFDYTNDSWTFEPLTHGTYSFAFSELRDANCSSVLTDVFNVIVHENPTADISPDNSFICEGESAYIYFGFTGKAPFTANYSIDNGTIQEFKSKSFRDSLLITPPATTNITLIDVVSDSTNCKQSNINKTVTITVTEEAKVFITGNNTICFGFDTQLKINVGQGSGPFNLTFNDVSLNGTYQNGDLITVTPDSTTTYNIESVSDIAGCEWQPYGSQVNITVIPLPTISFGPDTNICFGQDAPLTFDFLTGVGSTYELTFNSNDRLFVTDGLVNSFSPTTTTTYNIIKIVDNSGYNCASDVDLNVTVEVTPLPSAEISGEYSVCENTSVDLQFDMTGFAPFELNYTSVTNGLKTIFVSSNSQTDSVSPNVGTHEYTLTSLKMLNFPYCAAPTENLTGMARVNINPNPLPRFSMKDFDGCIPLTPTLINKTELIYLGTSTWDFGGGDVFEQNDSIFTKELITARGYDVTLTVKTPFGCVDSWTNPEKIWVRPFPVADFRYNPDPVSVANDVINFRDESTGAETYDWTMYKDRMGDIVDNTYPDINPKHPTPQEEGEYLVTMDIKSMYGCEDKIQKIITVLGEMLVNVPNSFTPNGDGVNDYFEPVIYGALPGDFSFIVFNRWGEIVFESNKIEHKAWDGFYKGKLLTDGQYVYKLIIKNKYTEKIQEFKGAFRLLN